MIQPPLPDSNSGGLPLADPRTSRTRSALRESNPPVRPTNLRSVPEAGAFAARPKARSSKRKATTAIRGGARSRTLKAFLVLDRFRGGCHRGHRPAWMPVGRACPSVCNKAAVAGVEPAIVSLTGSCLTVWPHRKIGQSGEFRPRDLLLPEQALCWLSYTLKKSAWPDSNRRSPAPRPRLFAAVPGGIPDFPTRRKQSTQRESNPHVRHGKATNWRPASRCPAAATSWVL